MSVKNISNVASAPIGFFDKIIEKIPIFGKIYHAVKSIFIKIKNFIFHPFKTIKGLFKIKEAKADDFDAEEAQAKEAYAEEAQAKEADAKEAQADAKQADVKQADAKADAKSKNKEINLNLK